MSLNGNMMLNIGPRANGDVPFEIQERLLTIGNWLERNGESIYGAGGFDLAKDQHDWCLITCKEDQGRLKLYLHIFNWPLDQEVKLTGILQNPDKIYVLNQPDQSLDFVFNEVVTSINLPVQQPDPVCSVVVVEYNEYPKVTNGLVAESMSNGYQLSPANWTEAKGSKTIQAAEHFGSVPSHVDVSEKSLYNWKVYVDNPGSYNLDLSYAYSGQQESGTVTIACAGQS